MLLNTIFIVHTGQVPSLVELCLTFTGEQWVYFQSLVEEKLPLHLKHMILEYKQRPYSVIYPTESHFS